MRQGIEVLVFLTNVDEKDIGTLRPYLDKLPGIQRWNFDLEDCDRILRVESAGPSSEQIILLFTSLGFICRELE